MNFLKNNRFICDVWFAKKYSVDEALVLLEENRPMSFEQQQIIVKKVDEIINLRNRDERHPIMLIYTKTTASNVWVTVVNQKPSMIYVYSPIHIDNLDDGAKNIIIAKYHNPDTPNTSPLELLRFEPEVRRPDAMIDQFIYALCYAICEASGQSHSDFVIGINDGSTVNIRRIVADIIRNGHLPSGNKEQVWLLQQ